MVSVTSLPSLRFEQDPGPTMLKINVYEHCRAKWVLESNFNRCDQKNCRPACASAYLSAIKSRKVLWSHKRKL